MNIGLYVNTEGMSKEELFEYKMHRQKMLIKRLERLHQEKEVDRG